MDRRPHTPTWNEARAYREEHERLRAAADHVAAAVASVVRAAATVGDHASAVGLSEAAEGLQLLQAQIATAAERAFSLGQLAARRAQRAEFEQRLDESGPSDPEPPASLTP